MRLVPVTNSQKTSDPRLNYKAFGGAKPARSQKEDVATCRNALTSAPSEPEWAAFAAIDWADQKNFWRLLPAGTRRSEAGRIGQHPGSRGGLGGEPAAAFWRPAHCRDFGAVSWAPGVYAHQVPAPGAVPGPPHHRGALSGDLHSFRRQERPQRHGLPAGSVAASSRTVAPPAAGYRGNPSVAFPGGGTAADGR